MNLQLSHLLAPESVQKAPELAELFTAQAAAVDRVFDVLNEHEAALDDHWEELAENEMAHAAATGAEVVDVVGQRRIERHLAVNELRKAEAELKRAAGAVREAVRVEAPALLEAAEATTKAAEDDLLAKASELLRGFGSWVDALSEEQWIVAATAVARAANIADYRGLAVTGSGTAVSSRALVELGEAIVTAVRRGNAGTQAIAGSAQAVVTGRSGVPFVAPVATAVALAETE